MTFADKLNKYNKVTDSLELIFKIVYLVHLVLSFNILYNVTGLMKISTALSLGLAAAVGMLRLAQCVKEIKKKDVLLILCFFASFVLSMFINYKYGLKDNIKCLVWMAVAFLCLYLVRPGKEIKKIEREYSVLGNILIVIMVAQGIFCEWMFFTQYNRRISGEGYSKTIGFYLNRLMGVYDDTNQGAVFSAICIIFALYFISKYKNIALKIYYMLAIAVLYLYIVLSVSRTGQLAIVAGIIFYIFIKIYNTNIKKKVIMAALGAGTAALALILIYTPIQKKAVDISNNILASRIENGAYEKEEVAVADGEIVIVEKIEYVSLDRVDVEKDVSNHRFDIWKWAIKNSLKKPVTGYGKYSYVPYIMEHEANNVEESNNTAHIAASHNMFIDVLVSQGAIGILIFVVWILFALFMMVRYSQYVDKEDIPLANLAFSLLIVNLAASMVMPGVLYINSPTAFMGWFTLGTLMYIMYKAKGKCMSLSQEERSWQNPLTELVDKVGMTNFLYVTGIAMYLTATVASLTAPLHNTEGIWGIIRIANSALRYGSYAFFLGKLIYDVIKNKLSIIKLIAAIGCIGLAVLGYLDNTVAFYIMIILAAHQVKSDYIVKTAVIIQSVITFTTLILTNLGFIADKVAANGERTRHFAGFGYVTTSPMLVLFIFLGVMYLRKGKPKIYDIVIAAIVNQILYKVTETRSAYYVMALAIIVFTIYGLFRKNGKIKKSLAYMMVAAPTVLCAGILALYKAYDPAKESFAKLNTWMSGRLTLGKNAMDTYGIHLFGSDMEMKGYDISNLGISNYNFIDTDYLQILILHGAVILFLVLALYTAIIYMSAKMGEYHIPWIILMILGVALTEPRLMNLSFNVFIILGVSLYWEYKKIKKSNLGEENGEEAAVS